MTCGLSIQMAKGSSILYKPEMNPDANSPFVWAFRPSLIFLTWSNNFLFLLKVVQGSTNYNSVFKRQLNPRINTRYLRLSPRYWHGWPCLRVDFLGCSKDEGKNCHCICILVMFPFKQGGHGFFA